MRTIVALAWIAFLVAFWVQWIAPDYGSAKIEQCIPAYGGMEPPQ